MAVILSSPAFVLPSFAWDLWHLPFPVPWSNRTVPLPTEVEQPRAVHDLVLVGNWQIPELPVVEIAREYLGVPYEYAGEMEITGTMDCSAFTVLVYKQLGIPLPRTSYGQVLLGDEVETIEDMLPGDLVFFQNTWPNDFQTGVTHVGIYIGDRKMIHSSARFGEVTITALDDPFYVQHWHSIRRILNK